MDITAPAIALGTTLLSAGLWWLKRKYSPTLDERLADLNAQITRIQREISKARARGDDARADALLRRLRQLAAAACAIGSGGQQCVIHTACGDGPTTTGSSDCSDPATGIYQ